MTLALNEDQQMFRTSVLEAIRRISPLSAVREWPDTVEADDRVRAGIATSLDLLTMTIPETHGGGGFAFADVAAGIEQFGAGLLPGSTSPTLTTILALVFGVAGDPAAAVAAHLAADGRWAVSVGAGQMSATDKGGGSFELTGDIPVVDGGVHATHLLCSGDTADGPGLFLVELPEANTTRQQLQTLDPTRNACELHFDRTIARRLDRPAGREMLRVRAIAALSTSLEAVGAMNALLTMAVSYAQTRFQFGRQIGSYQAVKHRLVNMQVEFELARAATRGAVEQVDLAGAETFVAAASAAKAACAEAGPLLAQEAIGVLGGIGYSWEHDAHLYFRRLNYLSALHGEAAEHMDTVMDELTRDAGSPR